MTHFPHASPTILPFRHPQAPPVGPPTETPHSANTEAAAHLPVHSLVPPPVHTGAGADADADADVDADAGMQTHGHTYAVPAPPPTSSPAHPRVSMAPAAAS
ncbi:hypothetical protein BC938DRAFT_479514 [Jimgerdemannia flammicorona]|uniref:Uncharacterized protein n=1 Tax=Jimgerdemannia flammicorona TaxID=994334 RepID=A0A433R0S6_9FUNG|nr:hypothetical protein BC938DRAFT_479514 [Jimgerdemannia flammicorona]